MTRHSTTPVPVRARKPGAWISMPLSDGSKHRLAASRTVVAVIATDLVTRAERLRPSVVHGERLRGEQRGTGTPLVRRSVTIRAGGVAATLCVLRVSANPSLSDSMHSMRTAVVSRRKAARVAGRAFGDPARVPLQVDAVGVVIRLVGRVLGML